VIELKLSEARGYVGLGVAGNFAGHLEQAGEAADFVDIGVRGARAPKGIFPFYVPGRDGYLGTFPLSHDRIAKPRGQAPVDLQIEPEMGLVCELEYLADGSLSQVIPIAAGAFNDCSIRRPELKISLKKNWGADAKGAARAFMPVNEIDIDGMTSSFRIASFLRRDGETAAYGIDTPVTGYSYYGGTLLKWLVEQIREQPGGDDSPLEPVGDYLLTSGSPQRALIGIGATRYTALGETTFLQDGDESIVVLYDGASHDPDRVATAIAHGDDARLAGASILRQSVYDAIA
jgi:hypothetical protein